MPNKKPNKPPLLKIGNARILFRNFAGREKKFNRKGDRNFCVVIEDPAQAQKLANDGWNIRVRPAREGEKDPLCYLPVAVRFDNYPPNIYMKTRRNRTRLDEEAVESLDYAEIRDIDLIINPSVWEANGKTGIKAYLKTMYVVIEEDEFAEKYASDEYPEE